MRCLTPAVPSARKSICFWISFYCFFLLYIRFIIPHPVFVLFPPLFSRESTSLVISYTMDSATLEGCSEPALLPTEEDYGPHLNRTIWILTTLSALFLGLRLYCKHWRCRSLWWDDYVLVASWVSSSPSCRVGDGR